MAEMIATIDVRGLEEVKAEITRMREQIRVLHEAWKAKAAHSPWCDSLIVPPFDTGISYPCDCGFADIEARVNAVMGRGEI
jgi:hypothetical protein